MFSASVWVWVEACSTLLGFVSYPELLIELLPVQAPNANNIDSKIPGAITLIANSRDT